MQVLEQHFDAAFDAPDGIKKLRELILTLAMQGKLVEQDPDDQPASELLKAIEAEKRRLVAEGKIRSPKALPPVEADEMPYKVSVGWEWVRLGDFGVWKSGSTPNRSNSDYYGDEIPWVKSGEVKQGKITATEESITQLALKKCSLDINPIGSVLIAMYGANIGEVGILEIAATTNQAVCACQTFFSIDNIFLTQMLFSLKQNFISQGAGAAQPNISKEKIIHTPVPLPPLAEQRRIVARIDELMARCDELEALRTSREQKRFDTHTAALNALLSAEAPDAFAEAWQFVAEHFGELHSAPRNVAELRKAVLKLAVMGKLVPQDPNDPPARELLKQFNLTKQNLIKNGLIKNSRPPTGKAILDASATLPSGWAWMSLLEAGYFLGGKTPSKDNTDFWDGDIPWVSPKDMKLPVIYDSEDHVTTSGLDSGLSLIPEESILMVVRSGILRRIFPVASNLVKCTINQDLKALVPYSGDIKEYLFLILKGFEEFILNSLSKTGVTVESIMFEEFSMARFPLPPLPEQRRIVAKIDQLMALCDGLEAGLAAQTGKQTELLSAVMAAVTPASTTPTRRAAPARAQAAWADPDATEASEPKRRGRPAKVQVEATDSEGELAAPKRRGRPPKNPMMVSDSIPSAASEVDAIRRLEALKLERAQGTRQADLFGMEM